MNQFTVLHKKENDAIVLLPVSDLELHDYLMSGYNVEAEGTKDFCVRWIDEFWAENEIEEDRRIFLNKRA